jgi:hypothetical protein
MDTQQMMELLLARLDENAKTSQQIMLAMREEMKAILDENTKTSQEILLSMEEDSKAWRE